MMLYPAMKDLLKKDFQGVEEDVESMQQVVDRAKQRFSPEELQKLEEMLRVVSDELMPEIKLPAAGPAVAEPQP